VRGAGAPTLDTAAALRERQRMAARQDVEEELMVRALMLSAVTR
jgi:hypothetical protein